MPEPVSITPQLGSCECGCGEPAPIAKCAARGYIKGQRMRFVRGHHLRLPDMHPPGGAKVELSDEQVSAAVAQFLAEGSDSITSLCGRIFNVAGTHRKMKTPTADAQAEAL